MFLDLALVYDSDARAGDLALGADGDLILDDTSVTPALLSVGLDRRAAPDDELPQGRDVFLADSGFDVKRGFIGDMLDDRGQRIGSRCWLLDRAKQTEQTRLMYQFWLAESLKWAEQETGQPAMIEVKWLRPQTLGWRVMVAEASISGIRSLN